MKTKSTNESNIRRDPISRWSIATKLIIAFLALAIVPMAATATYNLTQGQSAVARVATENLVELSRSTAQHIGLLLTENQRASATLAGQPSVIQFLAASEEERKGLASQVYQTLQNFADTHPDYDAPGLLDANGIVVASLADTLVGKDRSFRDYFQASIQGQPYVSSMLVGRATGRPGVSLTNPVVTAGGEIVGISLVWLKADTVWSIIDDVVVGEEGFAYLVDQDCVVIAHPDRDLLYHSLGELSPEAVATISATIRFGTVAGTDTPLIPASLGLDDLAAELALPPQSPPIPGKKSGAYRYYSPLDHRDHVVGYMRLEDYPWTVVVDLPEAQFLAPLQRLEAVTWTSVGAVAAITLIVSILLVRTITRPIRRLTDAATAVERGQPFEPADIADITSGRDEIAQLGRVFGQMVLALRQREERIEHLNLVLRAVRNVNQLIARERDLERLLAKACEILLATRDYRMVWIGLVEEGSKRVVPAGRAGQGTDYLDKVIITWDETETGQGPAGTALRTRRPAVMRHIATDPRYAPWRDAAQAWGYELSVAVPMVHGERLFGALNVYAVRPDAFDDEEVDLLQELANDLAFALQSIEDEAERVRAEEALRESEERYRLLAENVTDIIWTTDMNFRFTYMSPSVTRLGGYSVDEVMAMSLEEILTPASLEIAAKTFVEELAAEKTQPGGALQSRVLELEQRRKDGSIVWTGVTTNFLRDPEGRPVGIVGVTRDITERKRAEEALKEYSERLEEMVDERTKELRDAQEQLVRREKLAVLGQLAGGMGHELRNPLGVISNAVYFLHTILPDADETTREYLGIISSEVRDAEKIVSGLLDFSRTRLPDREKIAVSDLVAQVLERRPAPENVEVTTKIAPDLPPVFVDPRQIGQVLGNLATNAYQAMPDGGRLMIHASEGEGIGRHGDTGTGRPGDDLPITPSPCLRVSISDTGCGISPENLKKIFEPLFTTRAKGIGLGLAVSKSLVEANGGSIEVESKVGKGSAFTVWLPLSEQGLGLGTRG